MGDLSKEAVLKAIQDNAAADAAPQDPVDKAKSDIKSVLSKSWNEMSEGISDWARAIKDKVSSPAGVIQSLKQTFNEVKDAAANPHQTVENARQGVRDLGDAVAKDVESTAKVAATGSWAKPPQQGGP